MLAQDEKRGEYILFGKWIGFKKKIDDPIEEKLITNIFRNKDYEKVSMLMDGISSEVLFVTEKIIEFAEKDLDKKLNPSILLSLANHLQETVNRRREGVEFGGNSLQWEIPFLYVKESKIGKQALRTISEDLQVELPEMEAAFIALHFVNSQDGIESMDETMFITKSIVKTIQSLFDIYLVFIRCYPKYKNKSKKY